MEQPEYSVDVADDLDDGDHTSTYPLIFPPFDGDEGEAGNSHADNCAVLDFIQKYDIKCQEAIFIALIQHFGKAELIDKAVELFRDMGRLYNRVRAVKSFNTILNVLVGNDRVIDATELFRDGYKLGFKLNSVSYNIMVKMWLEKGEWDRARQVFDEMLEREVEPTALTYNCQIGMMHAGVYNPDQDQRSTHSFHQFLKLSCPNHMQLLPQSARL